MKRLSFLLISCLSFFLFASSSMGENKMTQNTEKPKYTVEADEEVAVLFTTEGNIALKLFPDVAPKHVANIKKLINQDYYNGIKFHRVIKGFMIQAGCPYTKEEDDSRWGTGGPDWRVEAEFNDKPHVKGTLSMARTSDPNSAGSQFFICHARAQHLDKQYTVFGHVVDGLDVVDKIATTKVSGPRNIPVKPIEIKKAEIMEWKKYQELDKKENHKENSDM